MRSVAGSYFLTGVSNGLAESTTLSMLPEVTVPASNENEYLIRSLDADYWVLSEYYLPQSTNCACSAASATMALNALRSRVVPDATPLHPGELLATVDDASWTAQTAENGGGVTFDELERVLRVSLDKLEIDGAVRRLPPDSEALRQALIRNETTPESIVLAYYNQSVVTGDPDGCMHVSPIGAYNAEEDRVLLMDVDRECWLPYWTSTETLMAALATPDPREEGALANAVGGCIVIEAAA